MPHAAQSQTSAGYLPNRLGTLLSVLFVLLCLQLAVNGAVTHSDAAPEQAEPGWVSMPAGARSAYLGIHGGTVPVSLLVSNTGTSLISFVGQTGNDFLDLLRRAELRLPSILTNATRPGDGAHIEEARILTRTMSAGTQVMSLPVMELTDDSVFQLSSTPGLLQPFGLSDTPLGIEGRVVMPGPETRHPRYHILVTPEYLSPRQPN